MAGAIVQTGYNVDDSGVGGTTIAVTLTITAGNHQLSFTGGDNAGAITGTLSDGIAHTLAGSKITNGADQRSSWHFYRENSAGGSLTSTATFTAGTINRRIRQAEASGLKSSGSLNQTTGQAQATPGTGANAVSSGASSATTAPNCFVIGGSQDMSETDPGTGTLTAGTGYVASGTNVIWGIESKSVTATGAQTATFTQSVNNDRSTIVAAYEEAPSSFQSRGITQDMRFLAEEVSGLRAWLNPAAWFGNVLIPQKWFDADLDPATSANLTLSIDTPGSITIQGQSISMTLGLALANGSITVAGQSVTMALGLAVATPGSITVQGQSVAFSLGLAVSTPGSITINGQSISLSNGINLAIDTPGSVTLNGQAAAMNTNLAVSPGGITIAGQSISMSLALAVSPGAVAISGQSMTMALNAALSPGSITIDGQSITLQNGTNLTLTIDTPGSISIQGQDVTLTGGTPTGGGTDSDFFIRLRRRSVR